MAPKKKTTASNNVFKTIVRTVVREELKTSEERITKRLDQRMDQKNSEFKEEIDEKIDNSYRKYRDDVLTGLDQVMGELKTIRQEQTMHYGQHDDLNTLPQRVEALEKIHPHSQHAQI